MSTEKIGRYEIISELGRGGMAVVYLAHDPQMKRDVAVKVLPRQFTFDEQFRVRFRREAEVIAALEHPNIVPVYDFGEDDDQPYIVMRYMPGGSLSDRIRQGPMSPAAVVAILERIGPAVDEAHSRGIIHRDFKPSNVLFGKHDDPYLADFGIVKVAQETAHLTGSGIVGTPFYMAPEVSDGAAVTPLVDIYALGVTLYQMLTGKVPYEAETPMGILMAHVSRPIPNVLKLRPDLPPEIQAVVERALAKSPPDRYQSAGALVDDLKAAPAGAAISRPIEHTAPIDVSTINLDGEVFTPPPPAAYRYTSAPASTGSVPRRKSRIPAMALLGGFIVALICLALVGVGYIVLSGGLPGFGWPGSTVTPVNTLTGPLANTPTPGPTETPTLTPSPTLIPINTIEPVQVSPLCAYYGHPIVYVEASRPVMLAWTWNAKTKELSQEHIDTATYRILLDGVEVQSVRRGEITYDAAKGWYSVTWYAEPVMLEVGDHLAERYLSWSRRISDGWSNYGPGTDKGTPHDTCKIIVR